MIVLVSIIIASAYFGPAEFWSIVGVGIALLGMIGGMIGKARLNRKEKKDEGLNLYIHFVDDLQVELKRLHDLVHEEREETAKALKERDRLIEDQASEISSLKQQIRDGR